MKIGILGSGVVGQILGAALVEAGHDVVLGTRSPSDLNAKRGLGASLGEWLGKVGDGARVANFRTTAAHGDVVINATSGGASLEALELSGRENLNGKILIDVANPLDFSHGMPPTLMFCNTESLGERIQETFPGVRVVKALNTTNAHVMVNPGSVGGGDHHVFVSGNDPEARLRVANWLREWFGWQHVIDLGDISTSRGTEMILPIWLRLRGALKSPMFNFKIVTATAERPGP